MVQDLWTFVLKTSDLRTPVKLVGPDGVGKTLAARKIHASGTLAGARLRFLDGENLNLDTILDASEGHDFLNRSGTVYIGRAECLSSKFIAALSKKMKSEPLQLPRFIFGFRSISVGDIGRSLENMNKMETFVLTPLSERKEDISPIARYRIWTLSLKEDFAQRWEEFERTVLPELLTRQWGGNVEELLGVVSRYCELSASEHGTRLVGEINSSVSSHWLKEQIEKMHEKLLQRWEHEDSMVEPVLSSRDGGAR
ncbi:MAG: hypothetical protein GWP41_01230 [Planctomycetia bacterium]|nr:hypothetical protein [Planctomycetia bacterium]